MIIRMLSLLWIVLPTVFWAQSEIRVKEENREFNQGMRNCLVVNVPYGQIQIVEKKVQRELKDWGGKTSSERAEFQMIQGDARFMGGKRFDAFARVIKERDSAVRIVMAVDLGGAFLSSKDHQIQFAAMSDQLKKLALDASEACVQADLDAQEKQLAEMRKLLHKLERQKKSDEASILKYERKIESSKQRIASNVKNQEQTKKDIEGQFQRVKDLEKRRKSLR